MSRRPSFETNDRIADQLAGAVVGDVAAAVRRHDARAARFDGMTVRHDGAAGGVATDRDHVRVLDENEDVVALVALEAFDVRFLQREGVVVVDDTEVDRTTHPVVRDGTHGVLPTHPPASPARA